MKLATTSATKLTILLLLPIGARWQEHIRVITTLIIVKSNLERGQLGKVNLQRATSIVDVLIVERRLGILRRCRRMHLYKHLKRVVLLKRDALEHGPELAEYLLEDVERHRVDHVQNGRAQHRILAAQATCLVQRARLG